MHRFEQWRDALNTAPDVGTVAGIMESYRVAIDHFLTILPPECRRALSRSPLEIQTAAITMLLAELSYRGSEEVEEVVHEVAHTFASAAVRVGALERSDP
jgi:hypothetical protein